MLLRTGMYHFEVSRTALYRVRYVLARTSTYHLVWPCTRCTGFQMSISNHDVKLSSSFCTQADSPAERNIFDRLFSGTDCK